MKKRIFALALALCCVITVSCMVIPAGAQEIENDLHLTKSVQYNAADKTVDVTLTAYASGTVSTEVKPLPTDFVLVLDRSNSMKNPYGDPVGASKLNTDKPTGYYCAVDDKEVYYEVQNSGSGWQINVNGTWTNLPYRYQSGTGWFGRPIYTDVSTDDIYVTKLGAMKDAACAFVGTVYNKAKEDNADHSIAVVAYAGAAYTGVSLSKLLGTEADSNYRELISTINGLIVANDTDGTKINTGLEEANGIFKTSNSQRKQIVVTLTDGVPSLSDGASNAFDVGLANDTIDEANKLKAKNVVMYSIGIFDGADPHQLYGKTWEYSLNPDVPCTGDVGTYWGSSGFNAWVQSVFGAGFPEIDIPAGNRLLNYISDNYTAERIGLNRGSFNPGDYTFGFGDGYQITDPTADGSAEQGYYLVAADIASLESVFEKISEEVTTSDVTLDEKAELRDVIVGNYFGAPDITVQVKDFDGTDFGDAREESGLYGTYYPSTKTISVTGFDYAKKMVRTGKTGGQQLVVTYKLPVSESFLGGNLVPVTDYAASGIFAYDKKTDSFSLSENFSDHTVDIPVKTITPAVQDQTIYLSNTADLRALLASADSRIDGTNNQFVKVTYALKNGDITVGTYSFEKGATTGSWDHDISAVSGINSCTPYALICTIDAGQNSEGMSNRATSTAQTATVHVLKPIVTGTDTTIKLGIEAPMDFTYAWNNTCSCEGTIPTVSGDQPKVEPAYSKTNDNKYPSVCTEYTVYAVVGGTQYNDIYDTFTVHVKTPVIEGADITIYRGNSVNVAASVVDWNDCACSGEKPTTVTGGEPEPQFSFSGGERVSPTDCTEYTATLTEIGGVELKDTKYKEKITDKFQVHVLQPEIAAEDATIYYGSKIDLDSVMKAHSWNTCRHDKTKDDVDKSVTEPTPQYSFSIGPNESKDAYSPSDCIDLTATWTLAGKDFTDQFTVHVAKPQFSTSDITIYRGNSADLEKQVNVDAEWKCQSTLLHTTKTLPSSGAPAITYVFTVNDSLVESNYSPAECKEVTATPTVGNKTWIDLNAFKVHVLQPTFTVETQDVWADYNNEVNLTAFGIKSCDLIWQDVTTGHSTPSTLPDDAPSLDSKTFTFEKGEQGVYTVGASDETVTVSNLAFVLNNGYGADYELKDKSFTIHVNKFDLTIKKTWNGADVYKQDAIFTVSGGLGKFQVVLPAGQESITVKNLLCGQSYTVTEDSGWTWRWDNDGTKTVTTHEHGVTTEMPTSHTEGEAAAETSDENSVSFINTLVNRLWFSFCKLVQNIFGVGSFERSGN